MVYHNSLCNNWVYHHFSSIGTAQEPVASCGPNLWEPRDRSKQSKSPKLLGPLSCHKVTSVTCHSFTNDISLWAGPSKEVMTIISQRIFSTNFFYGVKFTIQKRRGILHDYVRVNRSVVFQ